MAKVEAVDPLETETTPVLTDRLARSAVHTPEKATRAAPSKEAQMAALRRLFGDVVLSIFPDSLRRSVDDSYKFWMENPDSYLITDFDSEQDKLDSLTAMLAYAECADNGGYTIRTLADDIPERLVWRAQTRRKVRGEG